MVLLSTTETKDNIKYLSSMQRFLGPFYNGSVKGMNDAIPALMNSVKVSSFLQCVLNVEILLEYFS